MNLDDPNRQNRKSLTSLLLNTSKMRKINGPFSACISKLLYTQPQNTPEYTPPDYQILLINLYFIVINDRCSGTLVLPVVPRVLIDNLKVVGECLLWLVLSSEPGFICKCIFFWNVIPIW